MTLEEALRCPTLPVPAAGKIFYGLSRNGSYEAAKRGDIPTVRVGRKIMALVAPIAERLGLHHNLSDAAAAYERAWANSPKREQRTETTSIEALR